jgi:hypothetical protein
MYEDDPKIIDITEVTSKKIENFPIEAELYNRSRLRRKAHMQRIRNENYIFAMINLLLIIQSITVIGFIFILSKLY